MRTPSTRRMQGLSPSKVAGSSRGASPFKRTDRGGKPMIGSSYTGRSAFGDKTNQSPNARSPAKKGAWNASPSKTPWQAPPMNFVTPAEKVGRAGQTKALLGDTLETPMPKEAEAPTPAPMLSEEELYPPVEGMPASMQARGMYFVADTRYALRFSLGAGWLAARVPSRCDADVDTACGTYAPGRAAARAGGRIGPAHGVPYALGHATSSSSASFPLGASDTPASRGSYAPCSYAGRPRSPSRYPGPLGCGGRLFSLVM